MAEVIDMRGSWAANVARSKALQDARLQSHQAEAAALTKAHVKRRKVLQKLDEQVVATVDEPVQEDAVLDAQGPEQDSVDETIIKTEQAEVVNA